MLAAKYNLIIPKGADFNFTLLVTQPPDSTAVDLTGWHFKSEIRRAHKKPLIASFTFETETGTGNSTANAALDAGQLRFLLANEYSSLLDVGGKYEWDFFASDSAGTVRHLLYGAVVVVPNITSTPINPLN